MKRKREETLRRTNSKTVKKPDTKNYKCTLRNCHNRIIAVVPHKTKELDNILHQYFKQNPNQLYKYQRPPTNINMLTPETIKTMGEIFRTVQALKKNINGRGSTMNNPIIIVD